MAKMADASLNKIVIVSLLALSLGLVWWQLKRVAPDYRTYTNKLVGYTLDIPLSWQGRYELIEQWQGSSVSFLYQPSQGESALLFAIEKVTPQTWASVLANRQQRVVSRKLFATKDEVIYAHWLANNPYRKDEARKYLAMFRQVSAILSSFELKALERGDGTVCIQVITPAINPASGEVKEFPTPCDVPPDWEVIGP